MNKYQEAFGDIVDNGVSLDYFNDKSVLPQDENPLFIVQELVDKAAPMKKTIKNGRPYCAKCSYSLLIEDVWEMSYCCACGQKIDWGDEE